MSSSSSGRYWRSLANRLINVCAPLRALCALCGKTERNRKGRKVRRKDRNGKLHQYLVGQLEKSLSTGVRVRYYFSFTGPVLTAPLNAPLDFRISRYPDIYRV
ncbi:MAG TPA: hypothetical protein VJ180_07680 [Pyrinomonadaceae bacterium]|nr:hypothetical protein [Pyrinomonadaceae bacterium]